MKLNVNKTEEIKMLCCSGCGSFFINSFTVCKVLLCVEFYCLYSVTVCKVLLCVYFYCVHSFIVCFLKLAMRMFLTKTFLEKMLIKESHCQVILIN